MCFGGGAPKYEKPEAYKDLPSLYFKAGRSSPVYKDIVPSTRSSLLMSVARL